MGGQELDTFFDEDTDQNLSDVEHDQKMEAYMAELKDVNDLDLTAYTDFIVSLLEADLPPEAFKKIPGKRGLTDINSHYVIRRMNEVFGLLGVGWLYVISPHVVITDKDATVCIAVQYRLQGLQDGHGTQPYMRAEGTGFAPDTAREKGWSHPIVTYGTATIWTDSHAPTGDALKGAITNALTKVMSMLGVARNQVYANPDDWSVGTSPQKSSQKQAAKNSPQPDTPTYKAAAGLIEYLRLYWDEEKDRWGAAEDLSSAGQKKFARFFIGNLFGQVPGAESALENLVEEAFGHGFEEIRKGQVSAITHALCEHEGFNPAKTADGDFKYFPQALEVMETFVD